MNLTAVHIVGVLLLHFVLFYQVASHILKETSQSKTISDGRPEFAMDKDVNTCSIAGVNLPIDEEAWWRVELLRQYKITDVNITNTPGTSYVDLLNNLEVYVSRYETNLYKHVCAIVYNNQTVINGAITISCSGSILGNFVTIKRVAGVFQNLLVLCEVIIHVQNEEGIVLLNKPTYQSGVLFQETSTFAVDGNYNTCTQVYAGSGKLAWWRLVLSDLYDIDFVRIIFKANSSDALTLNNLSIYISNDDEDAHQHQCSSSSSITVQNIRDGFVDLYCAKVLSGRYVTIKKSPGYYMAYMVLCEVIVHGLGATNKTCHGDELKCKITSSCIPKHQICDKINHCPDGSDELNCTCDQNEYQCEGARCTTKEWLCDGIKDCPKGDDEEISACVSCGNEQFKCTKDNLCVAGQKRCNAHFDCPDSSDEQECLELSNLDGNNELLNATFKGVSNFHICSDNWGNKHSLYACKEMGFNLHLKATFVKVSAKNILRLKEKVDGDTKLSIMKVFENSTYCQSKMFVGLNCLHFSNETCGIRDAYLTDYGPYIVNGEIARSSAWPWYVQLIINDLFVCGGSIIEAKWILTAAHCVQHVRNASDVYVLMGTNIRDDLTVKEHYIKHIIVHSNYSVTGYLYDIALVKLQKPILFSRNIRKICLPGEVLSQKQETSFRYCILAGMGQLTEERIGKSKYLMQGRMNVLPFRKCVKNIANLTKYDIRFLENYFSNSTVLCAGVLPSSTGINSCHGDGGGAFACKNEYGIWTQVGIAMYPIKTKNRTDCAFTLFTRVDYFLNFIKIHLSS